MAVADSQGLTVSWGSINLGMLTNAQYSSPTVEYEEYVSSSSALRAYTANDGSTTHYGAVKRIIAGDITPGTVSLQWIGASALSDSHVGHSKQLTITHSQGALTLSATASLRSFSITGAVGELVKGTAEFQLEQV